MLLFLKHFHLDPEYRNRKHSSWVKLRLALRSLERAVPLGIQKRLVASNLYCN